MAFVFIDVAVDSHVESEVLNIDGVKELHALTGESDYIAKISARDIDELSKIISRIRAIKGVQGTDTRIVLATF